MRFDSPLYAIYPGPAAGPADVEATVTALCRAGVGMIQYRETGLADGPALAIARRVVQAALPFGVPVLVNDRADIARLADADGVHLGQDDLSPISARELLRPGSIVGISVDTTEEALAAEAARVDYVSLGPAYETSSKADVPSPRPLELFAELARTLAVPLVAIGGIGPDNVAPLATAGVSAVAVLSALYQGEDVEKAASGLIEAFRDAL